jgi:DNA (cytosine-5)-methyltransferase 1
MNQMRFAFGHELIVDLFAGGGGASLGIEQAFGRPVDVAVNHSADAVAMHQANHPQTVHLQCDVFEVNPLQATGGRQVGLLWASPDCKHFSKAKGGKPRSKKIRSLAWVVVKWATLVRPRVIMLENVEEFVTWGPLGPDNQPCPQRKGQTFKRWVGQLRKLGYVVEWKELRACDYGTPTIRKRFFLVARCDGLPIRWPAPTHGKPDSVEVRKGKLLPWRTAAECINWNLPCPSIFLTKEEGRAIGVKRPLAEATMKRIAKGVHRFVLDAPRPFIVPLRGTSASHTAAHDSLAPLSTITGGGTHHGLAVPVLTEHANASRAASWTPAEPLRTQCAEVKGGHFALATAFLTKYRADNAGAAASTPFPTITANGESNRPGGNPPLALVAAHMEQANAGNGCLPRSAEAPLSTVTEKGCQQQLVQTSLARADQVRAFMVAYYGNEKDGRDLTDPMGTVVSRERFGLVTVDGTDYAIADIGLRMLAPRELFRAQGFPESYVIDVGANGKKLPKDAQVRACGNSVCPPMARALVEANVGEIKSIDEAAAA